ncbi:MULTISPECIES: TetR-like C-terminal domain-containing protein [unclassified Streptomyces]|uniref:TetR-like C-terminal domain-containing protein n=1 Tax=unclassified Streptomyces TaxID=2593676 RepID=UPI000DC76F64|nr:MULTISPECIES: TetR-like C-terminal domain-containing protein [unclassified Streptomyces]AWZ04275.1 TetR family transcriptional regulator [Streptomyces sp. ICC4]AWZ13576.1 TetR family transcriptional regulator [Streptomyces sp. ICC1]
MPNLEQSTAAVIGPEAQEAVFAAVLELCAERTYREFDLGDIAARADVDERLISARWPAKSFVVVETLLRTVAPHMVFPRTGDIAADLEAQLTAVVELFAAPGIGPHLAALAAEANTDERLAGFFLKHVFGPNRTVARARFELAQEQGQVRADIDLDTAVDLVFGPIWFRLLLGTGPLDKALAGHLAEHALAGLAARP